jgi:hypothetical protein
MTSGVVVGGILLSCDQLFWMKQLVPDLDSHPFSWNVLALITERNQNWNSLSTLPLKFPLPL